MRSSAFFLGSCAVALALPACRGADVEPVDSAGPVCCDCQVVLDATYPLMGASDAYYRDPVLFEFSDAAPDATLDPPVPGTTVWDGDHERLTFTPAAPLTPSTPYAFTVEYCQGALTLTFSTSSLGSTPVEVDLSGRLYTISLNEGRERSPEGVGNLITTYLDTVLLGVVSHEGGVLELAVARPDDEGAQDYCGATARFTTVDYAEEPYFSAGGATLTMEPSGLEAPLYDIAVTGVFAPEGDWMGGVTFAATVDTRHAGAIVSAPRDPGAICDEAISFGAECVSCPDGEPYCLPLLVDKLEAREVQGVSLVEVLADDCAGCEAGPPAVCE